MPTPTKPDQIQTREVAPLELRAAVGNVNEKARTFDLVWSTGAKVLRSSWFDDPFYEELSMDPAHVRMGRLNGGAPFLVNHDSYDVARQPGVVESAAITGGKGVAKVRMTKAGVDPEADMLFEKIKDKVVRNVSVGYRVHKVERLPKAEGEKYATHRVIDWEPHEVSAVSIGADAGAGFRSAKPTNSCVFYETPNRSNRVNETNPQPMQTNEAEIATRAERERVSGILSAFRAAKLPEAEATKLITDGTSIDAARAAVLELLADRSDAIETNQRLRVEVGEGSRISIGETAGEKFVRGAAAWLVEKGGNRDAVQKAIDSKAKGFERFDLDGGEFRGMTLVDLAARSLQMQGVNTRGKSANQIVGMALQQRSGYGTPSDFPTIMEVALHKTALAQYAITEATFPRWCGKRTVKDFRDMPFYRMGMFGSLDTVPLEAEYQNKAIPDGSKVEIQTETKGNIIAIGRVALVNDDLGALSDIAAQFGRSAKLTIEKEAFALLAQNGGLGPTMADSQPFFHSNRANVGSSSTIGVQALDADAVVMAAQKDSSEEEILDLRPSVLLVPRGLEGAARVINGAQYDVTQSNKFQVPNIVQGMFKDVIGSSRLTASTTRRYLFCPEVTPAFVVAYLEGQGEAPYLEMQEGFRRDGIEWKLRIEAKVCPFDPKGSVSNAGT